MSQAEKTRLQLFGSALFCGVIFGLGLLVSGMTDPKNVTGFLDLFGHWNPYLMFVMSGAIAVYAPLRLLILRRKTAEMGGSLVGASKAKITSRLVIGSTLFGIGWGLGGVCPGPALVVLPSLSSGILVFVVTMALGWLTANRFSPQG